MSSASDVAKTFSISGLLDEKSKTRERFPVLEIDVGDIAAHPANVAYSMDSSAIRQLANSIKRDGLTDLPLVRRLADGGFQMISGHRRLEAFRLLAKDDAFSRTPCRIVEGITDAQAITLLHTANYFVRSLTVTERAFATEALGIEAERLRAEDPSLKGKRTEDIKAEMIEQQTGKAISGRTILRDEKMAKTIQSDLSRNWAIEANEGRLSASSVEILKGLPREKQTRLYVSRPAGLSKKETTEYLKRKLELESPCDRRLVRILDDLRSYMSSMERKPSKADCEAVAEIRRIRCALSDQLGTYRRLDAESSK